ncbi:unnamed protein product [Penicillium salamii]|nr:unnamed protein product [Penicillium salamii]CAG8331480.1 unnamed protein product [Penicillium salamii]CAG8417891.1 unnamed protein product [Penicillium salamii]
MPSLLNDSFSLTVSRSIFAKRPIKVVVGSEERVYYVHHGALEAHPAFEAQLKEATDDYMYHINWSAYDEQTVECALGFLYTGGYEAPEATSEVEVVEEAEAEAGEEAPAEEEVEEAEEVEEVPTTPGSETSDSPALSESDLNERPLTPLGLCCGVNLPEYAAAKTPETEKEEDEPAAEPKESSASEIYLHTKVYWFAHQLEFANLKQYSLNRLAKVLVDLEQTEKDLFPYLADGIRLIYSTTEATDDARYLLSQFVAFKYATLVGEDFDQLTSEGGEFMVDVSHKLARKLISLSHIFQEKFEELERRNEELEAESAVKDKQLETLKEEVKQYEDRGKTDSSQKYPAFTYQI